MDSSKKIWIAIAIVIVAIVSGIGFFYVTGSNQPVTQKQEHHDYRIEVNDTVALEEKQGKGKP